MIHITQKEFEDKFKSNPNVEVLTKSFFDTWLEDNNELLVKAESDSDLEDFEKSELVELQENIRSFAALEVYGRESHEQQIQKSIYFVREKQIEWDEEDLVKSDDGQILKARGGIYRDTATNRKLGRVNARYGGSGGNKEGGDGESKTESKITMNNLDWGKTTEERNNNLDKFKTLKSDEEREEFKRKLKSKDSTNEGDSKIRSIGVLNRADGNYDLTPVLEGEIHPKKVTISKEEYSKVKGDNEAMKKLALSKMK